MYEANYFLGANSPEGFASLYEGFSGWPMDRLFILKGGPGCGKSTFMRRIARAAHVAGCSAELVTCSGDPGSLDAVYLPEPRVGFVDGTSPHVVEPRLPGAVESYVNLGAFYDADALSERRETIARLTDAYKAEYARAYALIAGAEAVRRTAPAPVTPEDSARALRRAQGIAARELGRTAQKGGPARRVFLSALTCRGPVVFWDTVSALAGRVYVLENEFGLAPAAAELIASCAERKGYETIRCQDPAAPEKTLHVILPELSLAVVSEAKDAPYPGEVFRRLRLDAIPDRARVAAVRRDARAAAKLGAALDSAAVGALADAKALHDELEAVYNPHVDFDGVLSLADSYAARVF